MAKRTKGTSITFNGKMTINQVISLVDSLNGKPTPREHGNLTCKACGRERSIEEAIEKWCEGCMGLGSTGPFAREASR